MADIKIKKRLTLEFLGDEYKDSYIVFASIPVVEYAEMSKKMLGVENDNEKATLVMLELLEDKFVEGIFDGQKLTKEDIKQFDGETVLRCFETLTGQVVDEDGNQSIDPKLESESLSQSKTEDTATK